MSDKHPVIIHSLERKIIGERMLHTLLLTDPDFYEELGRRWKRRSKTPPMGASGNGSLPDDPGLWTAEFRVSFSQYLEEGQLFQESPWRPLTDEEAIRFAQGLPIEEVIVVENRQLELNFPTEEAKAPTDE